MPSAAFDALVERVCILVDQPWDAAMMPPGSDPAYRITAFGSVRTENSVFCAAKNARWENASSEVASSLAMVIADIRPAAASIVWSESAAVARCGDGCGIKRPIGIVKVSPARFPWALIVGGVLVNVFFDMDCTILGMDGSLRPGTVEVFGQLVASGHDVYVWSGMGVRWDEVRRSGLEPFVKGVYRKPLTDFRAGLDLCGVPVVPDFVIDDYPQIVAFFGGVCIKEYFFRDEEDKEMYAVLTKVAAHRVPAPDSCSPRADWQR